MKLMIFSSSVSGEHALVSALRERFGAAILTTDDVDQASGLLNLHGSSLNGLVIQREDAHGNPVGELFLQTVKSNEAYSNIPIIFVSEKWEESDFLSHQSGQVSADGYLNRWDDPDAFFSLVEQVIGLSQESEASRPSDFQTQSQIRAKTLTKVPQSPEMADPSPTQFQTQEDLGGGGEPTQVTPPSLRLERSPSKKGAGTQDTLNVKGTGLFQRPESQQDFAAQMPGLSFLKPDQGAEKTGLHRKVIPRKGETIVDEKSEIVAESSRAGFSKIQQIDSTQGLEEQKEATPMPMPTLESPSSQHIEFSSEALESAPSEPPISSTEPAPSSIREPESLSTDEESSIQEKAQEEMPYLFESEGSTAGYPTKAETPIQNLTSSSIQMPPAQVQAEVQSHASSSDFDTLKKYLVLRERDVAILGEQLTEARGQISTLTQHLAEQGAQLEESHHMINDQHAQLERFETEKQVELATLNEELKEVRGQLRGKTDQVRLLEQRVKEAVQEIERIRERVRVDMRRIRVREKELENRLEITTKDSEVLIAARENKIIDLKRKIDLSEFNLDLLQDKLQMEYEKNKELKDRLAKVGSAMKVAESWIEGESSNDDQMTQESEASAEDHDFYEDAS